MKKCVLKKSYRIVKNVTVLIFASFNICIVQKFAVFYNFTQTF
jgi:hypothetical protein